MNEKIIIGTGILIGILLLKKTRPIFVKGILIGLGICYSLTLFNIQLLTSIGFYGFGILSLAYSIFCVVKKSWLHFTIPFFSFVLFLFNFLYWNYKNELSLLMIIPITAYIISIINSSRYKDEMSVLTIFVLFELLAFVDVIKDWLN